MEDQLFYEYLGNLQKTVETWFQTELDILGIQGFHQAWIRGHFRDFMQSTVRFLQDSDQDWNLARIEHKLLTRWVDEHTNPILEELDALLLNWVNQEDLEEGEIADAHSTKVQLLFVDAQDWYTLKFQLNRAEYNERMKVQNRFASHQWKPDF